MTIHVNIGEAKTRLSELVKAAAQGEDVILQNRGKPQARLTAVAQKTEAEREAIVARRLATLGIWKDLLTEDESIVPPSMTEKQLEERWNRKFGAAA